MHSALAIRPKTVAEKAAGNIVNLLHFSSLDKMEQMVAWLIFISVDARTLSYYINATSHRFNISPVLEG